MLGIVFTGGEGPRAQTIKGLLDGLKAELIVAADSGLVLAEDAGFKPDWIIGDMDSVPAEKLSAYPAERVIRHEHNKDYTDTELAFSLAVEKGCDEIWIIGGGGGRLDHIFALRSLFERAIFPRRWITDNSDTRCIDASTAWDELSLATERGACVSVFPLGVSPWKAKSKGLKWQLDNLEWDSGFFGLSNVVEDGKFSIKAEEGRFMVVVTKE